MRGNNVTEGENDHLDFLLFNELRSRFNHPTAFQQAEEVPVVSKEMGSGAGEFIEQTRHHEVLLSSSREG